MRSGPSPGRLLEDNSLDGRLVPRTCFTVYTGVACPWVPDSVILRPCVRALRPVFFFLPLGHQAELIGGVVWLWASISVIFWTTHWSPHDCFLTRRPRQLLINFSQASELFRRLISSRAPCSVI